MNSTNSPRNTDDKLPQIFPISHKRIGRSQELKHFRSNTYLNQKFSRSSKQVPLYGNKKQLNLKEVLSGLKKTKIVIPGPSKTITEKVEMKNYESLPDHRSSKKQIEKILSEQKIVKETPFKMENLKKKSDSLENDSKQLIKNCENLDLGGIQAKKFQRMKKKISSQRSIDSFDREKEKKIQNSLSEMTKSIKSKPVHVQDSVNRSLKEVNREYGFNKSGHKEHSKMTNTGYTHNYNKLKNNAKSVEINKILKKNFKKEKNFNFLKSK